MIVKISLVNI